MLVLISLIVEYMSRNKDNIERQPDRQSNIYEVFSDMSHEVVHLIDRH